ncbi:IPT/TIG domain-containing protein [Mucilaginibacter sp. PPCGB 2223]|uniref:IPT/TIG domain-containing protein n=1 Tax=Mucilaginibacter sp. PPCGB 2223 TaxID=1886027 RepID=UPI0015860F16|nr:IPT/TIG domain-containing protein [Mucilaginibacter sp. PPCGB 2223]
MFIACFSGQSFSQLRQIHVEATENDISKVSFYSASEGYAGFSNFVGFTADSGHTFTQKPITVTNVNFNGYGVNLTFGFEITGVKAFNKNNIIVYGDYGLVPAILYSTDQGNTFKLVFHSQYAQIPSSTINDMVFPTNGAIGYAVDNDRILKTVDGGQSWTVSKTNAGYHYVHLQGLSDNELYVFTQASIGALFHTTDAGTNWNIVVVPNNMKYAYFLTSTKGWVNTTDGSVYLTTSGGAPWVKQNDLNISPIVSDKMIFTNDSTGYALVNPYEVYKTSNSGKIWERLHRNNNYTYLGYSLNDMQFMGNLLWAGGGHGFLELSTNSGGVTIPRAIFTIDASTVTTNGVVKLNNYSKSGYSYTWLVNKKPVSTSYNASYTANIFAPNDTIQLVVNNGTYADTATTYTTFSQTITLNNFTPVTAAKGETVTVNGSFFLNINSVSFGGVPAASFHVNSSGSLTAVVGNGASGSIAIASAQSSASISGFTYIPPPTITSFTPAAAAAGTSVSIYGTNFASISSITFGGTAATSFNIVSPTQVDAVVGVGTAGNIVITARGGTATISGFKTIPLITGTSVPNGSYGTSITINGKGFTDATAVSLDGFPVKSFTVNGSTSITAVLAEGKTGNITVTSPGGSNTYTGFIYYNPPQIKSFTPAAGAIGSIVTIKGANFDTNASGNIVYFGSERATVTAATDSTLSVIVPLGITYQLISVISHNNVGYASNPFIVTFNATGSLSASSFSAPYSLTVPNVVNNVVIADLNNDNHPEVIIPSDGSAGSMAFVYTNNSNPGNTNMTYGSMKYSNSADDGAADAGVADWDMDGVPDLFCPGVYNGRIGLNVVTTMNLTSPYFLYHVSVLNNNVSNATFYINGNLIPRYVAVNDMDGDGRLDQVYSLANTQFPNAQLADVDGDGKPDVLVRSGNNLLLYRNISTKGNITYAPAITFDAGGTINSIIIGDFDNDNRLEIALTVTGSGGGGSIIIVKDAGTPGNIVLTKVQTITTAAVPSSGFAADLDGDGKVDITVVNGVNISIFKNTSSGSVSFASSIDFNNRNANLIVPGDIDADGKTDIICSNTGGSCYIIRNQIASVGITSFTPVAGRAGNTITLTGAGFTNATSVSIDGVNVKSFTVNSDNSITAVVSAGTSGFISVVTPANTLRSLLPFTFIPPPVVTSFVPTTATQGSTINILGTNFNDASAVSFGGVNASSITVVSPTQITAVVGSSGNTGNVVVTTPSGSSLLSGFIFVPVPTITAGGPLTFAAGNSVLLTANPATGSYTYQWYKNGTAISGGTSSTYTATQSGSYTVGISANTVTQTSTATVVTVVPGPTITSFTPTSAAKSTTVTITGTNFTGATAVSFGGTAAASFTVVSATSITAVVASGAGGNVSVTTPGGVATLAGFNYVFTLPAGNFTLSANSATCHGSSNGTISITAAQSLNYTATITGGGVNATYPFTTSTTINNLPTGTYNVCFTVAGQSSYQQCFTVVITEPKDLSVYAAVNNAIQSVNLTLDGGNTYFVTLNGITTTTTASNITLTLNKGVNDITVTTDKPCQGVYQRRIDLGGDVRAYPNPFSSTLHVNTGGDKTASARIELYNAAGLKVYSKQFNNVSGEVEIAPGNLMPGIYMLKLATDQLDKVFKVVKQ